MILFEDPEDGETSEDGLDNHLENQSSSEFRMRMIQQSIKMLVKLPMIT